MEPVEDGVLRVLTPGDWCVGSRSAERAGKGEEGPPGNRGTGRAECQIEQQQSRARATLTPPGSGRVPPARSCSLGPGPGGEQAALVAPLLRGRPRSLIYVPFPGSSESSEFSEEMSSGLER